MDLRLVGVILSLSISNIALARINWQDEKPKVANQLIVKFKKNSQKDFLKSKLETLTAKQKTLFNSGAQLIEFKVAKSDQDLRAIAFSLGKDDQVEYVEPNYIVHAFDTVPNDARFSELWNLKNTGQTNGNAGADIKATAAWDITQGSKDVLVAVIDTGIDYTHPDIAPNYWHNAGETGVDAAGVDKSTNGVDDDNNGYIDDFRGWDFANNDNDPIDDNNHGTHCAGTIGASGNDGVGVVGVNWNVSLVGVKFLTGAGAGTTSGAISAIQYVNKIGAVLSSNSWGGGGFSQAMRDAIAEANNYGVLFVAAAGNNGTNNDASPVYPASYGLENIISVAATDSKDQIAEFSCFGANTVNLGAPGVDVLSSAKQGAYMTMSGTSMATPHVSGAVALVKARFPTASAAELKARVLSSVDHLPQLVGKMSTGGRLNVYSALEVDSVRPGVARNVAVIDAMPTSVTFEWESAGDDGDVGLAASYEARTSDRSINNEQAWQNATKVTLRIISADSSRIVASLDGLQLNSSGYIAIKAVDNIGNTGRLSSSVEYETAAITTLYENLGDVMDGTTAVGPWGIEAVTGRSVFSDSPGVAYANSVDTTLELPEFDVSNSNIALWMVHSYDLESRYDFGKIEISTDNGATWRNVREFTGTSVGWSSEIIELSSYLGSATTFKLRLHMTSDSSIGKNGWLVDALSLIDWN